MSPTRHRARAAVGDPLARHDGRRGGWALLRHGDVALRHAAVDVDEAIQELVAGSFYPDRRAWAREYLTVNASDAEALTAFAPGMDAHEVAPREPMSQRDDDAPPEWPVVEGEHLMSAEAQILLVSGSTRAGSTNTAVLRTAPQVAPVGVSTALYGGLADLPAFNPDHDHDPLPPAVADLRQQIAQADAVLFCTPEYAGALPGSFKNLLDWTVGGGEIYGKPVAWINVSSIAAPTGGADAHASLVTVLGYVGAQVVEAASARAAMSRTAVGADGTVTDPDVRQQLARVLTALQEHVRTADGEDSP